MKPISDPESEYGIIGCCLVGGIETAMDAVEKVSPHAFMQEDCRLAFLVLSDLVAKGLPVDLFAITRAWGVMHAGTKATPEIIESMDNVPSVSSIDRFIEVVNDRHRRRNLAQSAQILVNGASDLTRGTDEIVAEAEKVLSGQEIKTVEILEPKQSSALFTDYLEERFNSKGVLSGISTGIRSLDILCDGLQRREQAIIAARPSKGKTALAMNIGRHAALVNRVPTLVITCEMRPVAILRRMLADWHSMPLGDIKSGNFSEKDFAKFTSFDALVKRSPLYFVNAVNGIDCNRIASVVRRMKRKHGIELVIIDYLQKVKSCGKHEKKTYSIGEVSESLKATADDTNTAFLTLAQLNRDHEKDKVRPPRLSDLADSSQIEKDGDLIALLHRQNTEQDPDGRNAYLIIAKQRDGELGTIELDYEGQFCRFRSKHEKPEHP